MVLVVIAQSWEEAAPYRDLFDVLANRTVSMLTGRLNTANMTSSFSLPVGASEHETLISWITDISNIGISEEMESLLAGYVGEFGSFNVTPEI